MALSIEGDKSLYIKVEFPRIYGKFIVQFDLIQYISHPITGEFSEFYKETLECDYLLDGDNVFKQCYLYAKNYLEFPTLDC